MNKRVKKHPNERARPFNQETYEAPYGASPYDMIRAEIANKFISIRPGREEDHIDLWQEAIEATLPRPDPNNFVELRGMLPSSKIRPDNAEEAWHILYDLIYDEFNTVMRVIWHDSDTVFRIRLSSGQLNIIDEFPLHLKM